MPAWAIVLIVLGCVFATLITALQYCALRLAAAADKHMERLQLHARASKLRVK